MVCIRKVLPIVLAAGVLAAPQIASACHNVTVCLNWQPKLIDEGFGEVYLLGETVRARGARVTFIRPAPEPPLSGILGQDGCMTFETQFAYGHKVVVYAEAWVGTPAVYLHAHRKPLAMKTEQPPGFWLVDLHGMAPDDVVEALIGDEKTDPISPLMAVATEVIARLGELDVIPEGSPELKFVFKDYWAGAEGSCGLINIGPDSYHEKFVIAHEIGHWLQCEWGGDLGDPPLDYKYGQNPSPPPDIPCRFGVNGALDLELKPIKTNAGQHGIRSAEWSTMAMVEGFAHFIATVAFNEVDIPDGEGWFRYYKDINVDDFDAYEDFVSASSRVSLLGGTANENPVGGENRWTENQCPNDWDGDDVSTELDWMRFFWRFLTKDGATKPTLRQILEFLVYVTDDSLLYPIDKSNVWPQLAEAMGASSGFDQFLTRFQEANTVMGVYNDDTGS